jgi:hypothetical protein
MHWNYRVVEYRHAGYPDVPVFGVTEVFYSKKGKIRGWVAPSDYGNQHGETPEELRHNLKLMLKAFKLPVLIESELPGYVSPEDKPDDDGPFSAEGYVAGLQAGMEAVIPERPVDPPGDASGGMVAT